jgi:hypothetical protein
VECKHCKSQKVKKNGTSCGKQRYLCRACNKTFFLEPPRFTQVDKRRAIFMYLNNCGVRKTALFIGCSPAAVINWVREAKRNLDKVLEDFDPNYADTPDIIALDEIYTFVQKNGVGQSFGLLILGSKSALLRL